MDHQNDIAGAFDSNNDLKARETEVLARVAEETGFVPERLLSRSSWWDSKAIGAFHYLGVHQGRPAVLKVQGVRPAYSEADMIASFVKYNTSNIVRPPQVYAHVPWSDAARYEALVLEYVLGEKIVQKPAIANEVDEFFQLYAEYRSHCRSTPWVKKPDGSISSRIIQTFAQWQGSSHEIYPSHPGRGPKDAALILRAQEALISGYEGVPLEFMHGHFSADDLYRVNKQVVLLSNLFWSWRPPFYDAVFAYHWFGYNVAETVPGVTPGLFDEQRALWLERAYACVSTPEDLRLVRLALLERATAGLIIDAFTVHPDKDITPYVFEVTRQEILDLLSLLEG
jgi:hypothetical protein